MLSVLSGSLSVCVCVCSDRAGAKCFAQTSCLAKMRRTWQPTQPPTLFWDISKTLFSTLSQQHASMVSTFPSKLHRKVSRRRRRRKTRREIFFSVNNFYIPFFFFFFRDIFMWAHVSFLPFLFSNTGWFGPFVFSTDSTRPHLCVHMRRSIPSSFFFFFFLLLPPLCST